MPRYAEYADYLEAKWNREADEEEDAEETGLTAEERRALEAENIGDRRRDED